MNMSMHPILDSDSPEEAVAELVDAVKTSPDRRDILVELLPEQHPVYRGRSTNQTVRMRGYILAAFEQVGLPESAVPYVLDELQNGRDAYLVAAAAKALRGLPNPSAELIPFLLQAVNNIRFMDDALTFEQYKPDWPLSDHTSALQQIIRSFQWLGPEARGALPDLEALDREGRLPETIRSELRSALDSIGAHQRVDTRSFISLSVLDASPSISQPKKTDHIPTLEFEDQDQHHLRFAEFFYQKPSIVVFFYTRCSNPNKCSLTITKLGQLQRMISEEGLKGRIKTAAITYDPQYDLSPRLKAYGLNRGVIFGEDNRFFRSLQGWTDLQEYFGLGVNFNGTIVNQHRIELFILDPQGSIAKTFSRLQWNEREVLDSARALLLTST